MQNSNKKDNILILTQRVDINDDILGFFHGWIAELAKYCEKVTVICLRKGEYDLPDNVKVLSLGKEQIFNSDNSHLKHSDRIRRFGLYLYRFYKYIWKEKKNYDSVFAHMNKEYVLMGGLFWRFWGKKIGLWYVHRQVSFALSMAEKLANVIFTASRESFRLPSEKVKVMGHGIDVNKFFVKGGFQPKDGQAASGVKIISVGRISPIKGYETLIMAVEILCRNKALPYSDLQVDIVGGPATLKDEKYLEKLKKIVQEKKMGDIINFVGSAPNREVIKYYQQADLSINLCPTGGMDKAVLESMACGVPVITLNKTFVKVLEKYKDELILNEKDEKELAEKIKKIINLPQEKKQSMQKDLRDIVVDNHSLSGLIKNIIKAYDDIK